METEENKSFQVRIHVPADLHKSMKIMKIELDIEKLQEYSLNCMRRGHELFLKEHAAKVEAENENVAA